MENPIPIDDLGEPLFLETPKKKIIIYRDTSKRKGETSEEKKNPNPIMSPFIPQKGSCISGINYIGLTSSKTRLPAKRLIHT